MFFFTIEGSQHITLRVTPTCQLRVDLEPSIQSGLQTPVESIEGVQKPIDHTLKWSDRLHTAITQSLPNITAYISNVSEILPKTFKAFFNPF